jgi:hypothetical protein
VVSKILYGANYKYLKLEDIIFRNNEELIRNKYITWLSLKDWPTINHSDIIHLSLDFLFKYFLFLPGSTRIMVVH